MGRTPEKARIDARIAAAVTAQGLTWRPEAPDDAPFLEDLYVSVRWEEVQALPWSDEMRRTFLRSQFAAQRAHYAAAWRDCSDFHILLDAGRPIGRLYLHDNGADVRVIDVSLVPDRRGRGIGGALLAAVLAAAAAEGRTVSIHVEQFNPAQRLYRRLGFRDVDVEGPYILMQYGAAAVLS
jgi:GNAT superfamily N-acetyltransferase